MTWSQKTEEERLQMEQGDIAQIHHQSVLLHHPCVCAADRLTK